MATLVLKSKPVVEKIIKDLSQECSELKKNGITPCLKVLLVGNHPPSVIYTRNKKKFVENFGAECEIVKLDHDISEEDFLHKVTELASNKFVHGLFVQLPLPNHLNHLDIANLIPPEKDVDGFHPHNIERLMAGKNLDKTHVACTPKGIVTLLDHYNIPIEGKRVVIIGRSMIVGKPLLHLLTNRNATVTLCHSKTPDLQPYTSNADIIISAVGRNKFFLKNLLGDNPPVVIDVGINYDKNQKICGDVDFDGIKDFCSAITPVPGGVGPMTIASLGQNLIKAAKGKIK